MTLTDAQADALLAETSPRPPGWRRSARGNPTLAWAGLRLTVFERRPGGWAWSVADGRAVRYSDRTYPTEQEAKAAVVAAANRTGGG